MLNVLIVIRQCVLKVIDNKLLQKCNKIWGKVSSLMDKLVLDIRLNTLTFMFLIVSGKHNLAYGSLIVLQLPKHLFIVIL